MARNEIGDEREFVSLTHRTATAVSDRTISVPESAACQSADKRIYCQAQVEDVAMTVVASGWQNAFSVMRTNYDLSDDSIGVFALNLRFGLDDVRTVASEAITGGGDDKKCDIIYVDKDREIAVLGQCYLSRTQKAAAPANKASDLNTAITWLITQPLDTLPDGLKGRADEFRSAIRAGEIKQFYIWYVHNLPGSDNVKQELKAVEQTARAALATNCPGVDVSLFA